jgi:hypothetical protein
MLKIKPHYKLVEQWENIWNQHKCKWLIIYSRMWQHSILGNDHEKKNVEFCFIL